MRCLLDKVAARYVLQGLLKLAEGQRMNEQELFTLDLFARAAPQHIELFIVPPTANVLRKIAQLPRYAGIIELFFNQVETAFPTRYFKRWARRLREYQFSREDAAILALASFGTNSHRSILGMHVIATYDKPLIHHWNLQQVSIRERFTRMIRELSMPHCQAVLPEVLFPEQIIKR